MGARPRADGEPESLALRPALRPARLRSRNARLCSSRQTSAAGKYSMNRCKKYGVKHQSCIPHTKSTGRSASPASPFDRDQITIARMFGPHRNIFHESLDRDSVRPTEYGANNPACTAGGNPSGRFVAIVKAARAKAFSPRMASGPSTGVRQTRIRQGMCGAAKGSGICNSASRLNRCGSGHGRPQPDGSAPSRFAASSVDRCKSSAAASTCCQVLRMPGQRIGIVGRLVREAAADVIDRDHPMLPPQALHQVRASRTTRWGCRGPAAADRLGLRQYNGSAGRRSAIRATRRDTAGAESCSLDMPRLKSNAAIKAVES